jgi:uncharacterized protein
MNKSLCTKVCEYEEGTNVCRGCGRTSDEITEWFYASDERKREIVRMVRERKKKKTKKDYLVYKVLKNGRHIEGTIMEFYSFEECEQWCLDNSNDDFKWSAWSP